VLCCAAAPAPSSWAIDIILVHNIKNIATASVQCSLRVGNAVGIFIAKDTRGRPLGTGRRGREWCSINYHYKDCHGNGYRSSSIS
jgi:hypothetical protein